MAAMATSRFSARAAGRLKDEVYRQMLRLEAGHSAAPPLALALLNAWTVCDAQPMDNEMRLWLRSISPVCLGMIADIRRPNPGSAGSK
jgi:hypothetical protein